MPDGTLNLTIPIHRQDGTYAVTIPNPNNPNILYNNGGMLLPFDVPNPSDYSSITITYTVNDGINLPYAVSTTLYDILLGGSYTWPVTDEVNQTTLSTFNGNLAGIVSSLSSKQPGFATHMPLIAYLPTVSSLTHGISGACLMVLDPSKIVNGSIRIIVPEIVTTPIINLTHFFMWYIGFNCISSTYFAKCLSLNYIICP